MKTGDGAGLVLAVWGCLVPDLHRAVSTCPAAGDWAEERLETTTTEIISHSLWGFPETMTVSSSLIWLFDPISSC